MLGEFGYPCRQVRNPRDLLPGPLCSWSSSPNPSTAPPTTRPHGSHFTMRLTAALTFIASLFVCTSIFARQVAPIGMPQPAGERPLHFLADEHGDLWIRGATYKSSVSTAGAQYIPYLGSDSPRNYPLAFDVRSCVVGNEALDVAGLQVKEHGLSLDLDRGSFFERWTYDQTQAEQSFHFAELPNRGELVLSISWSSELEPSVGDDGFLWSNERGGVHYGRATALDAAGRKLALSTELVGDEIVIVVPAEFVAEAQLPLVVDPIVGTVLTIDASGFNNFNPQPVHDATTDTWLLAYADQFSGADGDVFSMQLSASGAILNGNYVDNSPDSWVGPSTANLNASDTWLVVAVVSNPAPATTYQIKGRLANSSGLAWGPVTTISDSASNHVRAVCAGDPYPSGLSSFLVAWERRDILTSIVYRNLLSDGSFVQSGPVTLDTSAPGLDVSGPIDLSRSNSGSFWTVTWIERCLLCPNLDSFARTRCIDFAGASVGAISLPLGGGTAPISTFNVLVSPPRSISDNRVLAARVVSSSVTPPIVNEIVMRLQRLGSAPPPTVFLRDLEPRVGNPLAVTSLDVDGDRFLLTYSSDSPNSPHVVAFGIVDDQLVLAEPSKNLGSLTSGLDRTARIASRYSSGGAPGRSLCAWENRATSSSQGDILGVFYEPQQGGAWTTFCAGDGSGVACPCSNDGAPGRGCGNSFSPFGAVLNGLGVASTTSDSFVLSLTSAPIGVTAMFLQGTTALGGGAGVVFGDGVSCVSGSTIRLGVKTTTSGGSTGGGAFFPSGVDPSITLRGAIPLSGAVRLYQVLFRDETSFCTPSTINLSNALRVTWLP